MFLVKLELLRSRVPRITYILFSTIEWNPTEKSDVGSYYDPNNVVRWNAQRILRWTGLVFDDGNIVGNDGEY